MRNKDLGFNIPCMGGFGSCEHSLCSLLENFGGCDSNLQEKPCVCPLKPGDYELGNMTFNVPDINSFGFFSRFLKVVYTIQCLPILNDLHFNLSIGNI